MPAYESTEEYLNSTPTGRQVIRIRDNVSAALTAIGAKGVSVPSGANSDDLADLIAQISGGGATYETYYDGSITAASDKTISIPSLSSLYFVAGETWRVTWDGTEYTCYPNIHEGWLWYIGNHGLTDGTDDGTGEPFCLYNYGGGALNGVARTSGTHTLKLEKQTSSGGGSATLITKSITANGTYSASDDSADGYSSVTVNVPTPAGASMNTQVAQGTTRRNNTALGSITSLTCETAGIYDVYWSCARSNTSQTWGSQLYINGAAYGSENTTWTNHVQNNHLTGVAIPANATVAVYGRSRSGYYVYAPQLTIRQTA